MSFQIPGNQESAGVMRNPATTSIRKVKVILTLVLIFAFSTAFVHKDRIERPKRYVFIFKNRDTLDLNRPKDDILKLYSDDIMYGKRDLIKAKLFFETGEMLIFQKNANKWTLIEIADSKKSVTVPRIAIMKIHEIHFDTIALLWNSNDNLAFTASYFEIHFEIGRKKSYNKYPELNLNFSGQTFSKSTIWRQVGPESKQSADF